jgi:peroxiredoxin
VGRTYGARAIPMTMVIDPDGVIVYLRQGTVKTGELDLVLREYIR